MEPAACLSNQEFIRHFNAKASRQRIPVSGSIDLTHRCNLRCVHCYLGDASRHADPGKEMTTGRILSVIDEITDAGCLFLLITGGEPLLRKDFSEIYGHAKKKGLVVTVFTNGTLLSGEMLDLFEDLPPRCIEISLYGATPETYESITGVDGSYEKCLSGIRSLVGRGISVRLKTILMTLNNHEFYDIEGFAKELGVKFRFDAAVFPRMDGDKSPMSLRVSAEQAVGKEFSDAGRVLSWEKYFRECLGQEPSDRLYSCGAGLTGFHIDPYGRLKPCVMVDDVQFDLSEGEFLTGWHNVISQIRYKRAEYVNGCNSCEKRHLCGFCPAFFQMETGSENVRSEYLCSMGSHRHELILNRISMGDRSAA